MAPLMLPIHIVGEISRPISLTLRLFGNIMGEDTVILVLTVALFPLLVPIPMLLMAIFTSMLQALVFTILTGVYLSGALSEGH
jgi:F-type H+-transporting ATPase subunit a